MRCRICDGPLDSIKFAPDGRIEPCGECFSVVTELVLGFDSAVGTTGLDTEMSEVMPENYRFTEGC